MRTFITCLIAILSLTMTTQSQEKLKINTSESSIKWIGEYTFYFGGHDGTINFKEGYFIKTNDVISGGEFIIDMTSIICNDIESEEANESLVNHLKDPDFFEVEKFKTAKIEITNVKYHDQTNMRIEANMTIKGKTLPINFQADVDFNKKEMTTRFKIDRRRWDINYTSKMKNSAISDAIGFEVRLSL